MQTFQAIFQGGDLTDETMALANEFTDETTARIARRLGLSRRPKEDPPA